MKKVNIKINGNIYSVIKWENILKIANQLGIDIPHFCYHEDYWIDANCRICLVENLKNSEVVTACTLTSEEWLNIKTDTKKVKKFRKTNLELLLSSHTKHCTHCKKGLSCKAQDLMKKYKINPVFEKNEKWKKLIKMSSSIELDQKICIACNNCVKACDNMWINHLSIQWKASDACVGPNDNECIYCGQCTVNCPVGAIREQCQIREVEKILKAKWKTIIVQPAPSIRVSIWDAFWMEHWENVMWKLYTAFRQLWFHKVFDVNMWADITTMVEAGELVERLKNKWKLPMFTSCCPWWVKFVESYHPELISNLTTARSPHIHSWWAYKTWWAKKNKINPKDIIIVSIMPCTAKKHEANIDLLNINWIKPVDYVLTTRELSLLLKKNNIDLRNLENSEVDLPWTFSWAWAIYWASWWVMESALRTAYFKITWKNMKNLDFKKVRWMDWFKQAIIKIWNKTLKIWVVSLIANAKNLINKIKKKEIKLDYIEVMACAWWCVWWWGQIGPSSMKKIEKRAEWLYKIDKDSRLRLAHENPVVLEFFEYVNKIKNKEKILHRGYDV